MSLKEAYCTRLQPLMHGGKVLTSQNFLMSPYMWAELKNGSVKVTTVDPLNLSPGFKSEYGSHLPILVDGDFDVADMWKIERHIRQEAETLFIEDEEIETIPQDLYRKFVELLPRPSVGSKKALLNQLRLIDEHLKTRNTKFLTGDTVCCFDCDLMPLLQHIRVAGKYFSEFEIPGEYTSLWRYMYNMYLLDAFTQSCPLDEDILIIYINGMKDWVKLREPKFTTSIPRPSKLKEPKYDQ